jgi:hypothetical protein
MPDREHLLNGPHPAPSEAQLDAGVDKDWHLRVRPDEGAQPEPSDDQRNTAIDGNAPHTQPEGEFTGSMYPVDAERPNEIEPADARMGTVGSVEDLDEVGRPVDGKTGRGTSKGTTNYTPAAQHEADVRESSPSAAGGAPAKGKSGTGSAK